MFQTLLLDIKMNKKHTILVTGGTGYVGSRVVKQLVDRGFSVRVIDLASPAERKLTLDSSVEFITGDLRNPSTALTAVRRIDTVVHLAADIGPLTYMETYQADILQNNAAIDAALYSAMMQEGVKTVLYSSSSMVFQKSPVYPYKETDLALSCLPTNIYGMSKLMGEYFCKAYHAQYGLQYVIMRYHNIYGPGEDYKGSSFGDIHVIPALIDKILSGQYPLEILGDENASRPFTYIDDAVDATVRFVEEAVAGNKKVLNEDFNVGPSEATKIIDLASLLWGMLGDGRPFHYVTKHAQANSAHRREMHAHKIEDALNWQPKVQLAEGIQHVAAWMAQRKELSLFIPQIHA